MFQIWFFNNVSQQIRQSFKENRKWEITWVSSMPLMLMIKMKMMMMMTCRHIKPNKLCRNRLKFPRLQPIRAAEYELFNWLIMHYHFCDWSVQAQRPQRQVQVPRLVNVSVLSSERWVFGLAVDGGFGLVPSLSDFWCGSLGAELAPRWQQAAISALKDGV